MMAMREQGVGRYRMAAWLGVWIWTALPGVAQVPTEPTSRPYVVISLPTVDLALDAQRRVVVESIPGQYLGHPTTVLLADGRTILCTYPLGHGGPAAVLKRSEDGGLTWSDRLAVPENWATATNCPCLHRLAGPDGVERLLVMEGNGAMRQAMSLDQGRTWTPLAPNGLHGEVAPITILPIAGGRHLAVYQQEPADKQRTREIWQSISADGGQSWQPERLIAHRADAQLCEPALVRSPDGRQLACLMRENTRKLHSMIMFSDDEGQSWTAAREMPASLTGDRHLPRYAPDGRLVIPFRDMAPGSATHGMFVAWVGSYEDLQRGWEGQYRIRLLNSPRKVDLGYPGLELLPDGTFVATTYASLTAGQPPSVVSVRFKLEETDGLLAAGKIWRPMGPPASAPVGK